MVMFHGAWCYRNETVKIHMIPARPQVRSSCLVRQWHPQERRVVFFLAHPRAENSVGKKQGHVFMKIMENANSLNHHLMYNVHDFFE